MNWMLAVAYVFAGTAATLLALVLIAIVAVAVKEGAAAAYPAVMRWIRTPRLANQS